MRELKPIKSRPAHGFREEEYSAWFPGTVKPVRAGWYEVRNGPPFLIGNRNKLWLNGRFRYFDGRVWRGGWLSEQVSIFGTHRSHQWRGINHNPNAPKLEPQHAPFASTGAMAAAWFGTQGAAREINEIFGEKP